jgi:hypothetical protein
MKGLIIIPPEKAREEYLKYLELSKIRKEQHIQELKKLYLGLSKGKKVIDIYEAFKFAGLNEKNQPKLAIVKANAKKVYFFKYSKGACKFSDNFSIYNRSKFDVSIPEGIICEEWEKENNFIKKDRLSAVVPIIIADKMPIGKLGNYYILWEVKNWEEVPKDPLLLKRITKNLFIVMEKWNLTKLEQALIRGK